MDRYKKAGARFFFSLANHHDSFDCWASKHQPWNAQSMGPHRDVVGTWARAARDRGLRFGVTIHQARNWWWFQTSHGADKQGPMAGVPYDGELTLADGKDAWWQGNDPQRLYGVKHPENALPDPSYVKNFYDRTRDLIDLHDPDLLYFDNALFPLGWGGMNIAAYYYNNSLLKRGKMDVAANVKNVPDRLAKSVVADYERGLTSGIVPFAWQSETCIGEWHYNRKLRQAGRIRRLPQPTRRDPLARRYGQQEWHLRPQHSRQARRHHRRQGDCRLGQDHPWMGVNGEAIYETRPWKVYGEGPNAIKAGSFQGNSVSKLGAQDVRFTRNKSNTVVYAIVLGLPAQEITVEALGLSSPNSPGKIAKVEVLGSTHAPQWKQADNGLTVKMPNGISGIPDYGIAIKASLA